MADEPVSMVDASLRASILDVMLRLKEEAGFVYKYDAEATFDEFLRSQKFLKFFIGKFILIYLSESPISSQPNLLPLAVQRG